VGISKAGQRWASSACSRGRGSTGRGYSKEGTGVPEKKRYRIEVSKIVVIAY